MASVKLNGESGPEREYKGMWALELELCHEAGKAVGVVRQPVALFRRIR